MITDRIGLHSVLLPLLIILIVGMNADRNAVLCYQDTESVDTQIVIVKYRIFYGLFGLSPLIAFFFHLLIKPSFLDNFGFITVS